MTDVHDVDAMLRDSFARIAEPGDPAGVVDSITTRMAAGDTGTPAATSGFNAGSTWYVPWLFGGAVVAIGGLLLGASGLLGAPFAPENASSASVLHTTVDALACPGGTPVATLAAGNRVVAVARSDDGAYVGVRNPYDTAATVWLPVGVVIADEGAAAFDALPVDGCGTASTTEVAPEPTETTDPEEPVQVVDTTSPALGTVTAAPSDDICADDSYSAYYPIASTVTVNASDNIGVTGVHIQWTGVASGQTEMGGGPGTWTYSFNPPQSTPTGPVTFVVQARDAAGNLSSTKQVTVNVIAAGTCLI